jgi:hypothetical protein
MLARPLFGRCQGVEIRIYGLGVSTEISQIGVTDRQMLYEVKLGGPGIVGRVRKTVPCRLKELHITLAPLLLSLACFTTLFPPLT